MGDGKLSEAFLKWQQFSRESPVFPIGGIVNGGCTTDLATRERIHNDGHGAEHTAAHRPVRLVYSETHESWPAARNREAQLKRWSHAKKQALVDENLARLHRLARRRRY